MTPIPELKELLSRATQTKVTAGVIHSSEEYVRLQKMGPHLAQRVIDQDAEIERLKAKLNLIREIAEQEAGLCGSPDDEALPALNQIITIAKEE